MRAKHKMAAFVCAAATGVAGLLACATAHAQMAVGGGSVLPKATYDQLMPSGVGFTYFSCTGIGSAAGKTAFFNNDATAFRNESLATRPAWPLTQSVHFADSDFTLTAPEVSNNNVAHLAAWGRMVQMPALAVPVLVPYKRAGISNLDLSDAQMCAVFSHRAGGMTWGQVLGTSDTSTIKLVYRTDGSGATEWLSRYLVAACPGAGFAVSGNFAAVVAGAVAGGLIPSHWVGAAGDSAMAASFGTDGRIGYLTPDAVFTGTSNAVVAKVNGLLPVATSIQAALAVQALPGVGTAAAGNLLAWVPPYAKPVPATGAGATYPIFGTTQLLLGQCYRDLAVQTKLRSFLAGFYGTTSFGDGLIALPAAWRTAIANTFLDINNPLGIGNVNVCNGIGRPLQN
ncbi:substrate-binding domain-containing protein [Variovorax sp. PAMC26660]|uniref:substrate-binding domain-containing protein n=1 Tax=Variovorax sp. PAMC26660 TaxID=2762322 RepID=UPI00164E27C0|nr:substrate-binding domain-containing protein [Variovorax sp. PAMC26660]QNK67001.1 substrate-binding domain-containing protein [Variovorax sp. PAMC26660]